MGNLLKIQRKLKAPKNQYNSFGKYPYRSAEDILEAVKPLLEEFKATLTLSDDIVQVGDRVYVKATATLKDGDEETTVTAFAREDETKKGMDGAQITGTASSYARKYALNGLFLIDDTKDADTNEQQTERRAVAELANETARSLSRMTKNDKDKVKALFYKETDTWQKNTLASWKIESIEKADDRLYEQLWNFYHKNGKV